MSVSASQTLALVSDTVLNDPRKTLEDAVSSGPRILVMDTSTILHDPHFLLKKRAAQVIYVIPEPVANEIDHHKDNGTETTSFGAREYLRMRELLEQDGKARMRHAPGIGTAIMYEDHATVIEFPYATVDQTKVIPFISDQDHKNGDNDNKIIQIAYYIQKQVHERKKETADQRRRRLSRIGEGADIIDLLTRQKINDDTDESIDDRFKVKLITKDKGMRRRAIDKGVEFSEYYRYDRISEEEVTQLHTGHRTLENSDEAIALLNKYATKQREYEKTVADIPDMPDFRLELDKSALLTLGLKLRPHRIYVAKKSHKAKGVETTLELWLTKTEKGCKEITLEDVPQLEHNQQHQRFLQTVESMTAHDLKASSQGIDFSHVFAEDFSWEEDKLYRMATSNHDQVIMRYLGNGYFQPQSLTTINHSEKTAALFEHYFKEEARFKKNVWRLRGRAREGFKFRVLARKLNASFAANEFVVVRNTAPYDRRASKLAPAQVILRYNGLNQELEEVQSRDYNVLGVAPKNLEQLMAVNLLLDPDLPLVILGGRAGTGKTFLSLAAGLAQLNQQPQKPSSDKTARIRIGIRTLEAKIALLQDRIDCNDFGAEKNFKSQKQRKNLYLNVYNDQIHDRKVDQAMLNRLKHFSTAVDILSYRDDSGRFPESEAEFEKTHYREKGAYGEIKAHYDALVAYFRKQIQEQINQKKSEKQQKEAELAKYDSQIPRSSKLRYSQIVVTRPIIPTGKDIGFLPGSLESKMGAWLEGIKQNLAQLSAMNNDDSLTYDHLEKAKALKVASIAHIRGSTYDDTLLIIDEAQNLTPHEVKTIITRAGQRTKVVLIGDPEQKDNRSPYLDERSSGMTYAAERFRNSEKYGHLCGYVKLRKGERSILSTAGSEIL